MSEPNTGIDWPSWVSAVCAILAIVISIVTAFRTKKYFTEYALVSSDGNVLSNKGFKDYGLHVRLHPAGPEYTMEFARAPDYFEITTREGAVVRLNQKSPLVYELKFVGAGYGSPLMRCNFKVQAY